MIFQFHDSCNRYNRVFHKLSTILECQHCQLLTCLEILAEWNPRCLLRTIKVILRRVNSLEINTKKSALQLDYTHWRLLIVYKGIWQGILCQEFAADVLKFQVGANSRSVLKEQKVIQPTSFRLRLPICESKFRLNSKFSYGSPVDRYFEI